MQCLHECDAQVAFIGERREVDTEDENVTPTGEESTHGEHKQQSGEHNPPSQACHTHTHQQAVQSSTDCNFASFNDCIAPVTTSRMAERRSPVGRASLLLPFTATVLHCDESILSE